MDGEAIKKDVLIAFEYAYLHDDWVNPLGDALAGLTAEEAGWRSGPGSKSIWEIVLHLAVWTEDIVLRKQSGELVKPVEGAWPSLPSIRDEAAWESAQRRLWDALAALRARIEADPPEALRNGPYGLPDLICRFIHTGYHIGQITKMREMRDAQRASV